MLPALAQEPLTIDLQQALTRARQYGMQIQGANIAAALAREDTRQARAARLPSLNAFNQFIYTEGNGTSSGVFVGADGVHVYNEQAQVHQELLSLARKGELLRARAAQAVAQARVDVAARGLVSTVVLDYYAIVSAQRRLANSEASVREAQQFLDITQKQEAGGEVAHSDVIKAQLQLQQRQRDVQDARLAILKAKVALAVLIFPVLQQDFNVVDDLQTAALVAPVAEVRAQALSTSPDIRAAKAGVLGAGYDVSVAHYAYLPSFALDFFYGISANQFAIDSTLAQATGRSTGPNTIVDQRHNLGYQAQITMNVPVWNWGATRSRIRQAELRQQQAQNDLTLAQRQLQANVASAHEEAQVAQSQLTSLQSSAVLAAESLRLTLLRYQAGEATALEVVDAQTTVTAARSALNDGLARYRTALANVNILTGNL